MKGERRRGVYPFTLETIGLANPVLTFSIMFCPTAAIQHDFSGPDDYTMALGPKMRLSPARQLNSVPLMRQVVAQRKSKQILSTSCHSKFSQEEWASLLLVFFGWRCYPRWRVPVSIARSRKKTILVYTKRMKLHKRH